MTNEARPGPKKTGSTPLERVVLRVSLLSLVAGYVLAVTGHEWGLVVAWVATVVGLGILMLQRGQGRI